MLLNWHQYQLACFKTIYSNKKFQISFRELSTFFNTFCAEYTNGKNSQAIFGILLSHIVKNLHDTESFGLYSGNWHSVYNNPVLYRTPIASFFLSSLFLQKFSPFTFGRTCTIISPLAIPIRQTRAHSIHIVLQSLLVRKNVPVLLSLEHLDSEIFCHRILSHVHLIPNPSSLLLRNSH